MTLTMATQQQIDNIQELVDQNMTPADIGDYYARVSELGEVGVLKVRNIAVDLSQGVTVEPDGQDLGQYMLG